MEKNVSMLVEYALRQGWITEEDRLWAANRILEVLELDGFEGLLPVEGELPPIHEILDALCADAAARGVIDGESITRHDLLDTRLMGVLIPRPSEIIDRFRNLQFLDPKKATEWYYGFSCDTNYIRRDRIARDQKWTVDTVYGTLDITVNLSKPEKDPKAIAAAGKQAASGYPKCLLCPENEGYAGRLNHPARQNHRLIPMELPGGSYYLQYSPYVYYNEHCIVLNREHIPMRIERKCLDNLLAFVTVLPHYFVGSNADLPIVGGSVLSHDHYQGGNYTFPMAQAQVEKAFTVPGFEDVETGTVKWPMSVIRLKGSDRTRLAELGEYILNKWRKYDDPEVFIFHETEGEPHNTVTPIARRRGEDYELDLVLRNNIVTTEHDLGVFHPHADKHHIKKENIGLIEVMGLAVLPARLKKEMELLGDMLVRGEDPASREETASHGAWAREVLQKHPELCAENVQEILHEEIGLVFAAVLEDAGVYKRDEKGRAAFDRFLAIL